jgi:hypothetical protein
MKKIAYSIFALLLLVGTTFKVSAQSEQSRSVSGFHSISSSGPFDVHIDINGTESLKINASADIINEIETVVEDGNLEIRFKHRYEHHDNLGNINVYITAKSLSGLANAGSGSIKVEGVVAGDNVNIALSGSGNISTAVKSGDLHATISGSGDIHLKGHASDSKVTISGSGELDGKELKTGSASVVIAGSGSAYFSAEKTISAHIVGSGNVVYTGTATVTDSKTFGSGSISKAE